MPSLEPSAAAPPLSELWHFRRIIAQLAFLLEEVNGDNSGSVLRYVLVAEVATGGTVCFATVGASTAVGQLIAVAFYQPFHCSAFPATHNTLWVIFRFKISFMTFTTMGNNVRVSLVQVFAE